MEPLTVAEVCVSADAAPVTTDGVLDPLFVS
jgi:hypothetical protein